MQEEAPTIASCSRGPDPEEQSNSELNTDFNLFYTASLQFLRNRLQEKAITARQREETQSCCNLQIPEWSRNYVDFRGNKSLSLNEILPYPKSKKSFLSRLINLVKKYKRGRETRISEENEVAKENSPNGHSFCLLPILEEPNDR
ncbi:unnamed protein product [Leptosia nina]|uniref:Uncharacterized protein n=1 Tax=Leptosia nina TaxID=320188 RepID=A0AAV1J3V2_9NEOP